MNIPLDKQSHFFSGAMLALAMLYVLVPLQGLLEGGIVTFGACVFAALAKEVYDKQHPEAHTPDPFDLLATSLGGLAGVLFVVVVEWLK